MLSFSITTLGCKVNQYDSCSIAASLEKKGLTALGPCEGKTDLVVINTCCVTTTAMRKSRQAIPRAIKLSPGAAVLVTGCYSDYNARKIRKLLESLDIPPQRLFIVGHHDNLYASLEEVVQALKNEHPAEVKPASEDNRSPDTIRKRRQAALARQAEDKSKQDGIEKFHGHQRAFVKVQDGCDAFCAYCIVPYTRPRVWSRAIQSVVHECRTLVASGHKEIVLSGVFLGAFGRDTSVRRKWSDEDSKLPQLLREVADIDGLWRVRLSSLEPRDMTEELLWVCRETPAVAPHFHLPLQSGSQKILKKMNRQYTADEFRQTIDLLRGSLENPAITTDIIVGFPGETDEDFAATMEMARDAGFAKIHAFPFSAIEGTAAWEFRNESPKPNVVKERMAQLGQLETQLAQAYRTNFVGKTMEGLVEKARKGSKSRQAMTDRYITVKFKPDANSDELTGKVVRLGIEKVTSQGLDGKFLQLQP